MSNVVDRDEAGTQSEPVAHREAAVARAESAPVEPRLSEMTQPRLVRTPKEAHHGKTIASWTGSMLTLVGAVIGTVGFLLPNRTVVIAGFVVVGIALVATVALRALGFGQPIVDE